MEYRIEEGDYVCYWNGQPYSRTEEVALLFSRKDGYLIKHGAPSQVIELYRRLRESAPHLRQDLVVVRGRYDLEHLHQCLTVTGYVGQWFAELEIQSHVLACQFIDKINQRS